MRGFHNMFILIAVMVIVIVKIALITTNVSEQGCLGVHTHQCK